MEGKIYPDELVQLQDVIGRMPKNVRQENNAEAMECFMFSLGHAIRKVDKRHHGSAEYLLTHLQDHLQRESDISNPCLAVIVRDLIYRVSGS